MQTDDLKTLDLDGLTAIFPEADRARHAGAILEDERTHRRRGQHTVIDASAIRAAKDVIGHLPEPSEAVHVLLRGTFRNSDFIPVVLDLADCRCTELSISTLGYDRRTGEMLIAELDAGRIGHLSLLSCVYHQSHEPELFGWLLAELETRSCRHLAARVHVKSMAFDFEDGRKYTIESSANLRSCRMMELSTITHDPGLTDFHHTWINDLFEKASQ